MALNKLKNLNKSQRIKRNSNMINIMPKMKNLNRIKKTNCFLNKTMNKVVIWNNKSQRKIKKRFNKLKLNKLHQHKIRILANQWECGKKL